MRVEQITTSQQFKDLYYDSTNSPTFWQSTPVQLYDLASLQEYLKVPTPLLKVDYNFVMLVKTGSLVQQIGIEKFTIVGPSLVFVTAGTLISIEEVSGELSGYFMMIEDSAMSSILTNQQLLTLFHTKSMLLVNGDIVVWFSKLFNLIQTELNAGEVQADVIHSLVQALLSKYVKLSQENKIQTRTEQIAYSFKQLVYTHFLTEKSPQFYADKLNVSANYLNRCVKNVFHQSAKEMLLEVSILYSKLQLWDKNKSIAEVAFELNFDDPSYFTRLFKKITGMTPTQYQLEH